jgi:restriction system protein
VGVDVDIQAQSRNPFITQELLIQVKDHSGFTDRHGIDQIYNVRQREDCYRWLISLGEFDEDVSRYAGSLGVQLMNGADFVEWIADRWQEISPVTQQKLGIVSVPQLAY